MFERSILVFRDRRSLLADGFLTIGEVAARVGVSLRTLRFYEQKGLLHPERMDGWTRAYAPAEVERLDLVVRLRAIGVPVDEIVALMGTAQADAKDEAGEEAISASGPNLVALVQRRLEEIGEEAMRLAEQEREARDWLTKLGAAQAA
jgi:DNA-binding transcriptional MerR regulator